MNALNPHNNLNEVSSIIVILFYRGGNWDTERLTLRLNMAGKWKSRDSDSGILAQESTLIPISR